MWKESEHPRNDDGTFAEKEEASKLLGVELDNNKPKLFKDSFDSIKEFRKYQQENSIYDDNEISGLPGAESISNKDLEKIISWYGNIPKNIYYVGREYIGTKEDFEKAVKKGLDDTVNKYIKNKQQEEELKNRKIEKENYIKDYAKKIGVSYEKASKINDIIDSLYEYDSNLGNKQTTQKGYKEGESSRSVEAKLSGKYPLSVAKKLFGLTEKQIKNNFKVSEWHHTGTFYNETDYYDLSELKDALYNDDYDYIKKIYKEH